MTMTMKMYVWNPTSLSDHTDGMVCVIAENKAEAIDLAVDKRHPLLSRRRGMSTSERAAVFRANLDTRSRRINFREELRREKPHVIRRGAVIAFGGS